MHPMLKQVTKSILEGHCPRECVVADGKSMGVITNQIAGKMIHGKIGKYPVARYPRTTSERIKSYSKYPLIQKA